MRLLVMKCIYSFCNEKATLHSGHLHYGNEIITAGFCEKHFEMIKLKPIEDCIYLGNGCYGNASSGIILVRALKGKIVKKYITNKNNIIMYDECLKNNIKKEN